jgi:hypothetical protein
MKKGRRILRRPDWELGDGQVWQEGRGNVLRRAVACGWGVFVRRSEHRHVHRLPLLCWSRELGIFGTQYATPPFPFFPFFLRLFQPPDFHFPFPTAEKLQLNSVRPIQPPSTPLSSPLPSFVASSSA